jgi:hypothetical protein
LNRAFPFQVLIADCLAGGFFRFAFHFVDAALHLIFVHDALLVMTVDDGLSALFGFSSFTVNKNRHKNRRVPYGRIHSDVGIKLAARMPPGAGRECRQEPAANAARSRPRMPQARGSGDLTNFAIVTIFP